MKSPQGGRAAGRLVGSIFPDDNQNGRREAGAVNVTVVLDGRYTVQTDAQGRFDFAYVAVGPQRRSYNRRTFPNRTS